MPENIDIARQAAVVVASRAQRIVVARRNHRAKGRIARQKVEHAAARPLVRTHGLKQVARDEQHAHTLPFAEVQHPFKRAHPLLAADAAQMQIRTVQKFHFSPPSPRLFGTSGVSLSFRPIIS